MIDLPYSYSRLKHLGFNPKRILDIGAHKGEWTLLTKEHFPSSDFFMIDATPYIELINLNIPYFIGVLYSEITLIDWYEIIGTGDSIFKENTVYYNDISPVKRQTTTLDIIFPGQTFEMIKIDCQGAEIPILKGGSNLIKNTEVVLLEIPFAGEYNKNVPNFAQHIQFMDSIGFTVFDIPEFHYINGFLLQIDIVFIRKGSNMLEKLQKIIQG